MELGEIKTPEFLARAVMAAEESGIKITNLEEVKERMAQTIGKDNLEQRISADHKRETEQREKEAIERSGFARELNVKEETKLEKTVKGLDALAAVSDMSDEEYRKYKESDEFKSQKLTKNQVKILDGIKKLQKEEKEGRISSKDKRYIRTMSKMIEDYKSIEKRYAGSKHKGKAQRLFAKGVVNKVTMQKRDNGR